MLTRNRELPGPLIGQKEPDNGQAENSSIFSLRVACSFGNNIHF
jgi:hypothetical protein